MSFNSWGAIQFKVFLYLFQYSSEQQCTVLYINVYLPNTVVFFELSRGKIGQVEVGTECPSRHMTRKLTTDNRGVEKTLKHLFEKSGPPEKMAILMNTNGGYNLQ